MAKYAKHLKPLARQLRSNMTDAEQRLWHHLRRKQVHGVQFYRQRPMGPYIVDFYAPAATLVIEVDGGQHFDEAGQVVDAERDAWLRSKGLRVLRFDNRQVLIETQGVLEVISHAVQSPRTPLWKRGASLRAGNAPIDGIRSFATGACEAGGGAQRPGRTPPT